MRLYYVDQDLRDHMGPEEMRFSQKQLYSYNIRSGDEIIVERKNWKVFAMHTLLMQWESKKGVWMEHNH